MFSAFQKFEKKFQRESVEAQKISPQTQFEYAWCLVRSDFPSDIKKVKLIHSSDDTSLNDNYGTIKRTHELLFLSHTNQGILLLEELVQTHSEGNRDYIYYLAIGNARIKEYSTAMKFCKAFLQIEPNNQQAITLEVSSSFTFGTMRRRMIIIDCFRNV